METLFLLTQKGRTSQVGQSVLKLPELKMVKLSDTKWHSHERCIRAIYRELLALIITRQQTSEVSGDAEVYDLSSLLATYTGVASVVFLSEVLDILAKMNAYMQRKLGDFSMLPLILKAITDQLEYLKEENSGWLCSVESEIALLKVKHDITLATHHGSTRSRWSSITTIAEYQTLVAIPYIDALLKISRADLLLKP